MERKCLFAIYPLLSILCSMSTPLMTPILTAINLDNNNIEHIASDPFQYCWNLTDLSLAYNRIGHLSSGNFQSDRIYTI